MSTSLQLFDNMSFTSLLKITIYKHVITFWIRIYPVSNSHATTRYIEKLKAREQSKNSEDNYMSFLHKHLE